MGNRKEKRGDDLEVAEVGVDFRSGEFDKQAHDKGDEEKGKDKGDSRGSDHWDNDFVDDTVEVDG